MLYARVLSSPLIWIVPVTRSLITVLDERFGRDHQETIPASERVFSVAIMLVYKVTNYTDNLAYLVVRRDSVVVSCLSACLVNNYWRQTLLEIPREFIAGRLLFEWSTNVVSPCRGRLCLTAGQCFVSIELLVIEALKSRVNYQRSVAVLCDLP